MLASWAEGVQGLRDRRLYALANRSPGESFDNCPEPLGLGSGSVKLGRPPLLGRR